MASVTANTTGIPIDASGATAWREVQEPIIFKHRASHLKKDTLLRLRTVDGRRELTFKGRRSSGAWASGARS